MISRVADHCFWFGRYVERAESTARLLQATRTLVFDAELSAYPYPAADTDLMTKPNYDGPMRTLPPGSTVTSAVFEFEPDGTVYKVVAGTPEGIASSETVTVSRDSKYKSVTVNGAGKIHLE